MCINCWKEAGSPSITNTRVLVALESIRELYDTTDGGVGGYGHIVFDDYNVMAAESCIPDAEKGIYPKSLCEKTRLASLEALQKFCLLTEDERYSCLAMHDGFINIDGTDHSGHFKKED